jgi:hypothetical protein
MGSGIAIAHLLTGFEVRPTTAAVNPTLCSYLCVLLYRSALLIPVSLLSECVLFVIVFCKSALLVLSSDSQCCEQLVIAVAM